MSAAEPAVRRRGATWRLFASEVHLVFGRRRNQVGMAVLVGLVVMLGVALKVSQVRHPGARGGDLLTMVAGNGVFLGFAGLTIEIALFLPLAVSVLAGDAVAGEANLGTLRYLLVAPVGRARLLGVKACALGVGALTGALLVALAGVLVGTALFGAGPLTTLSGSQLDIGRGLLRLLLAAAYVAAGLAALGMIGLFISTLTEQPMAATVATAMVSTLLWVLDAVPQLDWLHPWLLVDRWSAFVDLLRDPVFSDRMLAGLWLDAGYAAVFLLLAWLRFRGKDITS
ncbi:MAG: ABC transporter permease [Propionicimonas sp.]|uniref:ABC transporter permease n=1 Tax=Propionicimonas sp. TaxID=1955623 RepID=UPI003D0C7F62